MFIIKYRKVFFAIGILLLGVSLFTIITKGFTYGVDFTGGSVLQAHYADVRPESTSLQQAIQGAFPGAELVVVGDHDVRVRTETIDQETKEKVLAVLSATTPATEVSFNTIGPSVGQELRSKAKWSIGIVSLAIILFIAFAFRKVSKPISSWAYGIIAIVVLVHDVIVPAGYFAFTGTVVDTLFVVGLLTILGVSINDTIVVFDRIRENLHTNHSKNFKEDFATTVGKSIQQTFVRSIMTSLTVLIALAALYLYGPTATHNLAITMFLGMFFGTYSSIFLASPLLVEWNNWKNKKA